MPTWIGFSENDA